MSKHLASKVVSIALGEVGYYEKASNSQLQSNTANAGHNNWNKYADFIDKYYPNFYNTPKNGYDWCDIFVDYCHIRASDEATARKALYQPTKSAGAGCIYSAQYYRSNGAFINRGTGMPKPGDQIFFGNIGNEYHTGIVVSVSGGYVNTVEGNSGDKVSRNTYALTYSGIAGYGRPRYDSEGSGGSGATKTDTMVRIKSDSKLRSEGYCGGDSKVLITLKKGSEVKHLKDDSYGWSQIAVGDKKGWVQNTRLTKSGLSEYPKMTVTADVLNVRADTSTRAKIVGQIRYGTKITVRYIVESGIGAGWAEVAYPNSNGIAYVSAQYLK